MPFGPGTYGVGGGGQQAAPTAPGLGMPADMLAPDAAPDGQALSEIMLMLKGGQVGAERFLQLLNLLAQQTVPAMAPVQEEGPPSIQGLLG
jgi:hypothetical protein